jgi:hypothetical protein
VGKLAGRNTVFATTRATRAGGPRLRAGGIGCPGPRRPTRVVPTASSCPPSGYSRSWAPPRDPALPPSPTALRPRADVVELTARARRGPDDRTDIVLPSQLSVASLRRPKAFTLAVLEEAVGTPSARDRARDRRSRAIFDEVDEHCVRRRHAALSFVPICEVPGSRPRTFARVSRWAAAHRQRWRETAPPSYRFPFRRVAGTRQRTTARAQGMGRRRA